MHDALVDLSRAIFQSTLLPRQFMREIFMVASIAGESAFCQAHGGVKCALDGGSVDRMRALWSFEDSPLFSEAERVAFRAVHAACTHPATIEQRHLTDLRRHWSEAQCRHIVAISCMAAWRSRRAIFTRAVLDERSLAWARKHLAPAGWRPQDGGGPRAARSTPAPRRRG
jgi:hypothetical protein